MKICTINVTAKDIKLGVKRASSKCAVARAAKRVIPNFYSVGHLYIYTSGEKMALMPSEVTSLIYKLDQDREIKPFKFKVRL